MAPTRSSGARRRPSHALAYLLVDLIGGHAAAEHHGAREVAAVATAGGAHHVLGVEALLGELGHGEHAVPSVWEGRGGGGGEE